MRCLYLTFVIIILCSCEETPCEKELAHNVQQFDSLQKTNEKYKFRKDSLKSIFYSVQGKYLKKKDIGFSVLPKTSPEKRNGDFENLAGLVLVPEKLSFFVARYEPKENQSNEEISGTPNSDTVYFSGQVGYNEILINSSTDNDTIGINYAYYRLFYVFRENDTIEASIQYRYRVI